jgi:predicted transcriptional regulator
MEKTFEGSVPAFIAAFSRSKRLSAAEAKQLRALIDQYEE